MPDADDLPQLLVTPGQIADAIGVGKDGRVGEIGLDRVELRLERGNPVIEHGGDRRRARWLGR